MLVPDFGAISVEVDGVSMANHAKTSDIFVVSPLTEKSSQKTKTNTLCDAY